MRFISDSAGMVRNAVLVAAIATVVACGGSGVSLQPPSVYVLSPLVSDGWTPAASTDSHLLNPWGLAALPTSPMWVANNVNGTATLYDGTGVVQPPIVDVAVTGTPAGDVTGIVASNSETAFEITNGVDTAPARLIFATQSGTLLGWSADVDADEALTVYADAGDAEYTGLAIAAAGGGTQLYAADFDNAKIDIFDDTFTKLDGTGLFVDATLPAGYSPYNIKAIQRQGATVLAVAYAQRDGVSGDVVTGAGLGAVNIYSPAGALVTRLIPAGSRLNAPWGMAVAPANYGTASGLLLVGNHGDGRINGFSLLNGSYLHALEASNGSTITIGGLRGLAFGNGAGNHPTNVLYVTAGSNDGVNGLYARIDLGATAPDIVAPANVVVTEPAAAANVSGNVSLTATATDNVRVTRVVFSVLTEGVTREIGTDPTAPYTLTWNTATVANGAASLTATAFDAVGNSTTSAAVTVTVGNPPDNIAPTVSLTAPAPGDVSGTVAVTAAATDNAGLAFVQFFAGATSLGIDTTAPYSVQWVTTGLTGARSLTAVARDGAGNSTTSSVVQVNIVGAAVTLAQLQASIFTPLCARCHTGGGSSLPSSMNLSSAATSYDSLVGEQAIGDPGQVRVVPGNPDNSYLVRKLEGTGLGDRMPQDGPYLSPLTIDQVRTWIQAGAAP